MSRLIINRLVYRIYTVDGQKYGANIKFNSGLNIIFGPNSVGKTSIVTGIVYGLGAEKGLGVFKSIQNPFKPEFYKSIDGKSIQKSVLYLEISNGTEVATIFRYIKGTLEEDINTVGVKLGAYDQPNDYNRYIAVGDGVFSENGFQNFLFGFIGLTKVDVPTYDQKLSKLYFENIVPLFFVEQRAGWSQIQARQVTRYNIKDVKKVAFEYLFGLDRFNLHINEIKLKELETKLKDLRDVLDRKEENLLVLSNAEKVDDIPIVSTGNIGKTSIYDYISYLKNLFEAESQLINQVTSQNKDYEDSNNNLRNSIKTLDYQYRKESERLEKINQEISGYENYLDRIQKNKYKNKQLQKIQEVSTQVNIKTCPVCEAKLETNVEGECELCHSDLSNRVSTPDQNLAFLEDEENTFKKVISQRLLDKRKIIERRSQIKDKIKEYEGQLDQQTKTYAGKEFAALRQRILYADSTFKDMERYERITKRWEELNPIRNQIILIQSEYDTLKTKIAKYEDSPTDNLIISTIGKHVQSNVGDLGLFKGNKLLIAGIKVDGTDNYTPYLDNFDIYNISSSSDNIRIILSYYIALLQTSLDLKKLTRIQFPDLLILDEPKQQNLDIESLMDCMKLIENLSPNDCQVIMTTYSEHIDDRERLTDYIVWEMKNKTDYLLKKESPEPAGS